MPFIPFVIIGILAQLPKVRLIFLLVGAILQLQLSLHSPFFWPRIKSAMWSKSCHKPAMTGNGLNPTYKNGNDWGMNYGIVLPTLTGDCYNNGHGGWCKWHCFTNSIIAIARPSTIIDHHRPLAAPRPWRCPGCKRLRRSWNQRCGK